MLFLLFVCFCMLPFWTRHNEWIPQCRVQADKGSVRTLVQTFLPPLSHAPSSSVAVSFSKTKKNRPSVSVPTLSGFCSIYNFFFFFFGSLFVSQFRKKKKGEKERKEKKEKTSLMYLFSSPYTPSPALGILFCMTIPFSFWSVLFCYCCLHFIFFFFRLIP